MSTWEGSGEPSQEIFLWKVVCVYGDEAIYQWMSVFNDAVQVWQGWQVFVRVDLWDLVVFY